MTGAEKMISWSGVKDQLAAIFVNHCDLSNEEFSALRNVYQDLFTAAAAGDQNGMDYRHVCLAGVISFLEDAQLLNHDEVSKLIDLALHITYPDGALLGTKPSSESPGCR